MRAESYPAPETSRLCCRTRTAGFVLVEILLIAAVLWIAIGLLISLSRHVRSRSAESDTARMLWKAHLALSRAQSAQASTDGATGIVSSSTVAEASAVGGLPKPLGLDELAIASPKTVRQTLDGHNRVLVHALLQSMPDDEANDPRSQVAWARLSRSMFDGQTLRDAWGTPVVLARGDDQRLGLAPGRRDYCLSAGPDRNFLTRDDNLYSFEQDQPADTLGGSDAGRFGASGSRPANGPSPAGKP